MNKIRQFLSQKANDPCDRVDRHSLLGLLKPWQYVLKDAHCIVLAVDPLTSSRPLVARR